MKTSLILAALAAAAALAFIWPTSAETAHEIPAPTAWKPPGAAEDNSFQRDD